MADPRVEQLKRVPIFAQCSRAELATLARNTDDVPLPAGRTLIEQGKTNHSFFILLSGNADVHIDGRQVNTLGPGDIFGEISMLDRGMATATVITTSPVDALVMSHAQFRDAVQAQQSIALKVIATMAERLRRSSGAEI